MKNVALLVYDATLTGGAERVALNMAHELSCAFNIHLISLFHHKKAQISAGGSYRVAALMEESCSITRNFFSMVSRLRRYICENDINVLYAITAGVVTVAIAAAVGTKTKIVYCEHSNLENKTYGKHHEFRQWAGAKFSQKVVTLTEQDRRNFIANFHLCEDRVETITNWFSGGDAKEVQYNTMSKGIISVGRLEAVKGFDMLIKVAAMVRERHKDWHWDIYGEGSKREELEASIREYGLEDFVVLKGNVANIQQRYTEYAMFVMTSYYEGLPLVLLEAQVAKLPVVSFDCPTGPAEIVIDAVNGFLVSAYDIEEMSSRICQLIEQASLREAFSQKSNLKLHLFDKNVIVEKWINLTERMLA